MFSSKTRHTAPRPTGVPCVFDRFHTNRDQGCGNVRYYAAAPRSPLMSLPIITKGSARKAVSFLPADMPS